MADNPYQVSLSDLARSTGHGPEQQLIETEAEPEVPHALPIRATPMSPASEIAAFGQLANARPSRKRQARFAAVFLLLLFVPGLLYGLLTAAQALF